MFAFLFKKTPIFKSKINGSIHIGKSFGKKALFVGNIPQSGGEFSYMWKQVLKKMPLKFIPKNCLVLGVAAGTVISILQENYPKIVVIGIELDPVILNVAKEYFEFPKSKVKLVVDNAITWVKQDKSRYDLIVVDLYLGDLNPKQARGASFLESVHKLLRRDGVVLYNCHYQKENDNEYQVFTKKALQVFQSSQELFKFPKNKILLLA